ncbi:T9SS type A sorting domain-containing protein, partial [Flavobacterium sp.]
TIGGNGNDVISETLQLENGNFILLGFSNSNISGDKTEDSKGSNDYWIIEINSLGEIIWQKTIGGDGSDISTSLIKTTNNTLLLGGHSSSSISGDKTESCRGFSDYWIVELNSSGDILWQKTIGGNQEDKLLAITESNDNNYLITGNSSSGISGDKTDPLYGIGGADSWIVKINTVGNILFQKTIGSTGDDGLNSILQENDGGIFLSGGTNSPSTNDINELPIGINDYWILRLTASLDTPSYPDKAIFSIAPNPTNSNVSLQWQPDGNAITIGLYSPLGQLLSHQNDASGLVAIELPEANGVYILKINTVNDQYYTFKILKM